VKKRVVIVGNGITANMIALLLQKQRGDVLEVVVVGPEDRGGAPVVGESTIEITTGFLEQHLGLGQYLRQTHYPKFGLTYYFQLDPSKPEERTYSVHQNQASPVDTPPLPGWEGPMARPPSWQLNRTVFDRDLRRFVDEAGVERVHGIARDIAIDGQKGHRLAIETTEGEDVELIADWVIDASGRSRFLGRRLRLTERSPGQRNCFWIRLRDFDRSHLAQINALGPMPDGPEGPYHYDRYFSTHHFFGRGNWVWLIPMRTADDSELISIGITSHPDHFAGESPRTIEAMRAQIGSEHHALGELLDSGTAIDTNTFLNYHYTSSRLYSPDRWCVIGDAGFTLDPLFSNGLAFSSMQMLQIEAMISRDVEGDHDPEYIDTLSSALLGPLDASQDAICDWYATMDDAFVANLRLYWIEISYFYALLPSVHNRCFVEPARLSLWNEVLNRRKGRTERFDLPKPLIDARRAIGQPAPEHFIYMGVEKVNPRALEDVDDSLTGLLQQFRAGANLRSELTRLTLERAKLARAS
jgi:flavin-dependent dehydrogenase